MVLKEGWGADSRARGRPGLAGSRGYSAGEPGRGPQSWGDDGVFSECVARWRRLRKSEYASINRWGWGRQGPSLGPRPVLGSRVPAAEAGVGGGQLTLGAPLWILKPQSVLWGRLRPEERRGKGGRRGAWSFVLEQ